VHGRNYKLLLVVDYCIIYDGLIVRISGIFAQLDAKAMTMCPTIEFILHPVDDNNFFSNL